MVTQDKNLERYLNLWNIFENLLEKKSLNLSSFAKKWQKESDSGDLSSDYKTFYAQLKKKKSRKNSIMFVRNDTISQIENYIKFLDSEFVTEELRDDEKFEHWFD